MKKIFVAAIALFFAGASASAQSKDQGQKQKMGHELGLTAEQKEEMKRIREAEKNEMEALKKDESLTKDQQIAARKAIHEKYRTQFKNVLTDEQQKKATEFRKDHSRDHKMKKDSGLHRGAAPKNGKAIHRDGARKDMRQKGSHQKMESELNLSAEQKSRMAASREEYKSKALAIKKNDKLTREQKQAEMKTLSEKQREEMRTILTEEQRQKMAGKKKAEKIKRK